MKQKLLILFSFLLNIPILFLVYFNKFNFPTLDDFCYANETNLRGFWEASLHSLMTWSGRYFSNTIIGFSPVIVNNNELYNLIAFILIVSLPILNFTLITLIFKSKLKLTEKLFISSLFTFFLIYNLPNVSQGFYWLSSSLTYIFSILMLFILLIFIVTLIRSHKKYINITLALICNLLIICIVGSNETIMLPLVLILINFLIYIYLNNKNKVLYFVIFLIITLCSIVISLTDIGNQVRLKSYAENKDLFKAIVQSIQFSDNFFIIQFHRSPLIIISLILIILFLYIFTKKKIKINNVKLYTFLAFMSSILVILMGIFPSYYAQGNEEPVTRATNVLFITFLIFWFTFIFFFSYLLKDIIRIKRSFLYISTLLTLVILSSIFSLNFINFKIDLENTNNYSNTINVRKNEIETCQTINSSDCVIDGFKTPLKTTFSGDIRGDKPNYFSNQCFAKYYNLKKVRINI